MTRTPVNAAVAEALGASAVAGITGSLGTVFAGATVSATARVKHTFWRQHLLAARHFANLAVDAEAAIASKAEGDRTEQSRSEHRAYVSGAVVFAAAFLEASINELYLEATDPGTNTLAGLSELQKDALSRHAARTVKSSQNLSKYQTALAKCRKAQFDKRVEPFRGADGLVEMRNALVHYRPEWSDEPDEHDDLRGRLTGRFQVNPLVAAGSLWFPHLCMGAGCAQWAVDQAAEFSKAFCERMGVPERIP
jgi:hypothetical protein